MRIRGLTKKYGNLTVYENFDMDLQDGKITCVLGGSGSGKTTLLNCIAKLTDCSGDLPQVNCAYVFQTPCLIPNLTLRGNLKLVCGDDGAIDGMLEKVRLSGMGDRYPVSLSGGQAKRVGIARAFLFGGDIILMDEPFNSLDLKLKTEISSLFAEIQKEYNRTALVVTHDVDEALALADRIAVISGGKIVYDAEMQRCGGEITDKDKIRRELVSALLA